MDYNFNGSPTWKLTKDLVYDAAKKAMLPRALGADEEIDTKKLDDLKSAIDDLKIVDVERKPAAVPPDLRLRKEADVVGVSPCRSADSSSTKIRTACRGISASYRTRETSPCNSLTGLATSFDSAKAPASRRPATSPRTRKTPKRTAKKDEATPGSNRYMFVMAEFNQDAIPKPAFEEMPKDEKKPDEKKADEKKPMTRSRTRRRRRAMADDKNADEEEGGRQAGSRRSQEGCGKEGRTQEGREKGRREG